MSLASNLRRVAEKLNAVDDFFRKAREVTENGEWAAYFDVASALPRLEQGRCPACSAPSLRWGWGADWPRPWRKCSRATHVIYQVRAHEGELFVIYRRI